MKTRAPSVLLAPATPLSPSPPAPLGTDMYVPVYDPAAAPKRDAVQRACDQCRTTKQKCDGFERCSRCLGKGQTCSYLARNKKNYTRAPPEHGQVQRRRIGVRVVSEENIKLSSGDGGSGEMGGVGANQQQAGPSRRHSTGPGVMNAAPSSSSYKGSSGLRSTTTGRFPKRKSSSVSSAPVTLPTLRPPTAFWSSEREAEDEGESIESEVEVEAEAGTVERQMARRVRTSSATSTTAGFYSPHTSYFSPTYATAYPSPPYSTAGLPLASAPCSPTYAFLAELAALSPTVETMPEVMRSLDINTSTSSARSTLEIEEPEEIEEEPTSSSSLGLFGLGGMSRPCSATLTDSNNMPLEDPFNGHRLLPFPTASGSAQRNHGQTTIFNSHGRL